MGKCPAARLKGGFSDFTTVVFRFVHAYLGQLRITDEDHVAPQAGSVRPLSIN
jgi:hypothetical protein